MSKLTFKDGVELANYNITDLSCYIPTFNPASILDAESQKQMDKMLYDYDEAGNEIGVNPDLRLNLENLDVTESSRVEQILKSESDNKSKSLRRDIERINSEKSNKAESDNTSAEETE